MPRSLTEGMAVKRLCSTATHVSDQLVGVQKILYQTHIGSKLRRHLLSPPRCCTKHTSQHAELLSSQRFLPLSRSFTCDGSFGEEFVGVVFKINGRTRIRANSDSEDFQDPQRYKDLISDIHFHPCHHRPGQSRNRQRVFH